MQIRMDFSKKFVMHVLNIIWNKSNIVWHKVLINTLEYT